MELFNILLEIKIGKKDLPLKAVFIENSIYEKEWRYFIYYYDMLNHTFYINDLDYLWAENRTRAINIIELIITKTFKQELNLLPTYITQTQIIKKPKVFCIYREDTWLILIDRINLKAVRWEDWHIIKFKKSSWNINDTNKIKLKKIKDNLSFFYKNKMLN